jgi:predicted ATPase
MAAAKTEEPILISAKLKENYRCFGRGRKFSFEPGVNLLVGDQGSGKSSLINLIVDYGSGLPFRKEKVRKLLELELGREGKLLAHDFEKANPRTLSHFLDGAGTGFQVGSMFSSHGQTVRAILKALEDNTEPAVILLDEPDMALSPRSAHELGRMFNELAAAGNQLIVAVHNPIVIASQPRVLSLEHGRWLKSETFLAKHAEPADATPA